MLIVSFVFLIALFSFDNQCLSRCEFESLPWRGVLDTKLYDKICHDFQ